jgi:hypothetical protein
MTIAPTVELLIDQSGSMSAPYGNTDRWTAMRSALLEPTTGVVANLASRVYFGATLFSAVSQDVGGVLVGVPPCPRLTSQARALDNFAAIRQLLQDAAPLQDTPTPEAIDAVRMSFEVNPPIAGSPPIIILATDGLPDTCADTNPPPGVRQEAANAASVAATMKAYAAGIKLFFLFIGNAQAGTHPQQMANAGAGLDPVTGTAPFYAPTDPAQLTAAFHDIIDGVRSCDLTLSGKVDLAAAPSGIVLLDGALLTYGVDWALDRDGLTIHLVGSACTTVKNATSSMLDATFSCSP